MVRGRTIFPECVLRGRGLGGSCLLRSRTSSPAAVFSKGQGHPSQGRQRAGLAQRSPRISTRMVPMTPPPPVLTQATDIITNPSCSKTMDPDKAFSSCSGQHHHGRCGSTGDSDQCRPSGNMTLRHQVSSRWLARPWASAESSVVIGAMDITSDPGLCRATDPDMALQSCLGQDVSKTPN